MTISTINHTTILIQLHFSLIFGEGIMRFPRVRQSQWNNTNIDHPNNSNCGGFRTLYEINHGMCGVCGDDYSLSQPRPNEFDAKRKMQLLLIAESLLNVTVRILSPQQGYFEFALCPMDDLGDRPTNEQFETEECFANYTVEALFNMKKWYMPKSGPDFFNVTLRLPQNLTCHRCTFRWQWTIIDDEKWCKDEKIRGEFGCAAREIYRNCADVRIDGM